MPVSPYNLLLWILLLLTSGHAVGNDSNDDLALIKASSEALFASEQSPDMLEADAMALVPRYNGHFRRRFVGAGDWQIEAHVAIIGCIVFGEIKKHLRNTVFAFRIIHHEWIYLFRLTPF